MRASTRGIEDRPAVASPDFTVEEIVVACCAGGVDQPGDQRVREELVAGRQRGEHFLRNALEPDRLADQEGMQRRRRAHVRRAEQDELAHPRGAVKRDPLLAAVEHVDRAVAQVIARDQPAHAVSDDVDPQRRVVVVAAQRFDQAGRARAPRRRCPAASRRDRCSSGARPGRWACRASLSHSRRSAAAHR